MRESHLDACAGRNEQFLEARKRSAYHEAGHALLECLVAERAASDGTDLSAGGPFGHGNPPDVRLDFPEGKTDDPWSDALVLLGGPAAEAVIYSRDVPPEQSGDCSRAERLLYRLEVRFDFADVFAATKELVEHHRGLLEALMGAIYPRGSLSGSDMWRLFQSSLREPQEP